jgi:hypothetical protein
MERTEALALAGDRRQRVQEVAGRARQRVTVSTSPLASWPRTRCNWARLVCAPLAVSFLDSGGAQLLHLRVEALAVGRYSCIASNHGMILHQHYATGKSFNGCTKGTVNYHVSRRPRLPRSLPHLSVPQLTQSNSMPWLVYWSNRHLFLSRAGLPVRTNRSRAKSNGNVIKHPGQTCLRFPSMSVNPATD